MKSLFATWAQWKRPRVWEVGAFSCHLSCAITAVQWCASRILQLWSWRTAKTEVHTSSPTHPSLTALTKWVPPHRAYGPAHTWLSSGDLLPSPAQKLSKGWALSRGHLCSRRHISENAPDHRVPPPCLASAAPSQEPIDFLLLKYINVIKVRITQPGICDLQP